jgi:hypothetical protein
MRILPGSPSSRACTFYSSPKIVSLVFVMLARFGQIGRGPENPLMG